MAVVAQVESKTPVNWETFQTSERFLVLTPKQRMWLAVFLGTNDPMFATKTAFRCATDQNAKIMSYEVRKNPNVKAALAEFQGRDEREILLEEVQHHLRHAEEGSIAAQRLLAQKERLILGDHSGDDANVDDEPKPVVRIGRPRKRYSVGELVQQSGHLGKVLAVDNAGHPTEIEAI